MNKKIIYSAQSLFFNIEDLSIVLRHDFFALINVQTQG